MRSKVTLVLLASATYLALAPPGYGGLRGFKDKFPGGKKDPALSVYTMIAPNSGAQAYPVLDDLCTSYQRDMSTGVVLAPPIPSLPQSANGGNQFVMIEFPFNVKRHQDTLMKADPSLAATSFLTSNISVTDENGVHVPVIASINGSDVFGSKINVSPDFPLFLDSTNNNKLVGKTKLVLIADDGDGLLGPSAAFGASPGSPQTSGISELRIRIDEVGGVLVNAAYVIRVGQPAAAVPLAVAAIDAESPLDPPQLNANGNLIVDADSRFLLEMSTPCVAASVGVAERAVRSFNKGGPAVPAYFSGNIGAFRHPCDGTLLFPNIRMIAKPVSGAPYEVPFDACPVNPNNNAMFWLRPLAELPDGEVTLELLSIGENQHFVDGVPISSSVTSVYNDGLSQNATVTFGIKG